MASVELGIANHYFSSAFSTQRIQFDYNMALLCAWESVLSGNRELTGKKKAVESCAHKCFTDWHGRASAANEGHGWVLSSSRTARAVVCRLHHLHLLHREQRLHSGLAPAAPWPTCAIVGSKFISYLPWRFSLRQKPQLLVGWFILLLLQLEGAWQWSKAHWRLAVAKAGQRHFKH